VTYCIGLMLDQGMILARDSRTNADIERRDGEYLQGKLAGINASFVDDGDAYFCEPSREWSEGTRQVFRHLPELRW
jgi:predicted proteasome-type protease